MNNSFHSIDASRKYSFWLVYIWMPVSIGTVVFWRDAGERLQIHHLLVLIPYVYAIILSIAQRTLSSLNSYLLALLLYVGVSGGIVNYASPNFWLKLFSFFGVVVVANHISKTMTFEEFVSCSVRTLKVVFVLSLIFAVVFYDQAFSVVDGKLSINSFYSQKNTYGRLVYFLLFFYVLQFKFLRRLWKFRDIAFISLCFVAIVLSNSRTSIGIAIMIFAIHGFAGTALTSQIFKPLLIALVAASVGLAFVDEVNFVGVGDNHDSVSVLGLLIPLSGRATIWHGVIDAVSIENKWLFGFGLEGFYNTGYAKYVTDIGLGEDFVPGDSHNGYIDLVVNLGLAGAVIYLAIIYRFLGLVRRIGAPATRGAMYIFFMIYLISNFTESFFVKTSNITSFLFMLMFLYAYRCSRTHLPEKCQSAP